MEKVNNNLKSNLNFIVLSLSSILIFFMIIYMLLDMKTFVIRFLMMLEFLCDFYLMTRLFYKYQNYKKNERYIEVLFTVFPFMLSVFNLFYVFNFFSIDRTFLRNVTAASLLTSSYKYIFSVYILRIINMFYTFSKEERKSFNSLLSSKITIFISLALLLIFFIFYMVFSNVFVKQVMPTYNTVSESITFNAQNTLVNKDIEEDIDEIEYKAFAEIYDIIFIYYDNELKYSHENFNRFRENNLLFETSIFQGFGFLFIRSGKVFTAPFYIFLILYIITLSFTLLSIIIFVKYIIKNNLDVYVNIMLRGFKDDNYHYAIDTSAMEENEIKELSELYNNKLLSYKYRERYIKSTIK